MARAVAGFLLCSAWYYTILSGFYILYCPVMYLMFLNHKLYRKIVDALFALWELYPVALFQCFFGTHLHHYGDYVDAKEKTIIFLNHRTRVDWNYVWIALYHATRNDQTSKEKHKKTEQYIKELYEKNNGSLNIITGGKSRTKFVLKDEIKFIPGMGWIMQLNFFLYLRRDWRKDQVNIAQFVGYYRCMDCAYRMILFPEGTDLSDNNQKRSEKYAQAHNLPNYTFVLHPRTTGWAALCSHLRETGLESVYDVTIAYDKPAQTERDLLRGRIPRHVYFHFKRYLIEDLPTNEEALKSWLIERWTDKESNLRKFHLDGSFMDPVTSKTPEVRTPRSLVAAKLGFLFWSLIDILFTYAVIANVIFQFWVMYHSLLFVFVTWYFGGFQNIQYQMLNKFN